MQQEDPTFRPLMYQRWERVAFLHWAYHPRALQRRSLKLVTDLTLDWLAWSPDGVELAGLYNEDVALWPPETDILIFDVFELT